jgi:hypothetical protein
MARSYTEQSSAGLEEATALIQDRPIPEFDGYAEVKEICRPGNHFLKNPGNRYPAKIISLITMGKYFV